MNLFMSGLDYRHAALDIREKLAFSPDQVRSLLVWLRCQPGVEGCVLLSTCNRTELYLTGSPETPWRLLCRGARVAEASMDGSFATRCGPDAARHLLEVACGLRSQILGEAQIITQVRRAMELAQQAQTADATLSALFRAAVTAGKRARSEVTLTRDAPSIGSRCRDILTLELGALENRRILVIGNGQMGQLAASVLRQSGAAVWVTLRAYRHGQTPVPPGCTPVAYEDRLAALDGMDALVSATASPHYTLTAAQLETLSHPPRVAVDLAVPRDIDPACAGTVPVYDMDALGLESPGAPGEIAAMEEIVREELDKFTQWQRRQSLPQRPPRFPLFVDLSGKKVVLVGGGTIAARRIGTLRLFGCRITVISPELSCSSEGLTWQNRPYRHGDLEGAYLAIAATSDRQVNRQVGLDAQALGIPVSVADCETECSFYFPAVCTGGDLIAGVVSTGKDHHKTARAAKAIRHVLEELP